MRNMKKCRRTQKKKIKNHVIEQGHGVNFAITDLESNTTMMILLDIKEEM
ncbi:MAG: hypothetical protein ACFFB9_09285 [Promethearchaeota archaeon]